MSAERWDKLEGLLMDMQDAIDRLDETPFGRMGKALDKLAEQTTDARAALLLLRRDQTP